MKRRRIMLAAAFILASSMSLTGCHGIIAPSIGENTVVEKSSTAKMDTEESSENEAEAAPEGQTEAMEEGGTEAAMDMSSMGQSEPVVAPEMIGNVVYHFHYDEEKTTSLGALAEFIAEADLYDEANADGFNGVVHLSYDTSETYMTCIWTDNGDGTLSLQMDEFTTYTAKDVDGVLTIVGIHYALGMSGNGVVDIPLAE